VTFPEPDFASGHQRLVDQKIHEAEPTAKRRSRVAVFGSRLWAWTIHHYLTVFPGLDQRKLKD
jgi:hypothetical protein